MEKTAKEYYEIAQEYKMSNNTNKAIEALLKSVELGYDKAKIELATLYLTLNPNEETIDEILELVDSVEEDEIFQGEINLILGVICGLDYHNDVYPFSDAIKYLTMAVDLGCIGAYYYLYGVYVIDKNLDKAKETLIIGAEKGNEECIFFLAIEFNKGIIFKLDNEQAVVEYSRLINTKSKGMGAYGLYRSYRYGLGVDKNIKISDDYKKITLDTIFNSEKELYSYESKLFYDNLTMLAENNVSEAMYDLALISLGEDYIGIDDRKNVALAKGLLEDCIKNEYYEACTLLSDIYKNEDNISVAKSLEILALGIAHDDKDSAREFIELTDYLDIAKLNLENVKLAHKLLVNSKTLEGMYYYARCLDYGYYRKVDSIKAKQLYMQLIQNDYYDAYFNLGLMYQEGRGVVKNIDKAFDLYNQGVDKGSFICQREIEDLKDELSDIIDFTGL